MVILITGCSHSGKTLLAQRFMEQYKYPYLSLDHLKMGMIRSHYCTLSPESSEADLTCYLWPIVREIIKTNIENNQNIIIEGCYIPFDYKKDFTAEYLTHIQFICLIFSQKYLETSFLNLSNYAQVIETRKHDCIDTQAELIEDNKRRLRLCKQHNCDFFFIDDHYELPISL